MSGIGDLYKGFLEPDGDEILEQMAFNDLEIDRNGPIDNHLYVQAQNYFKWGALAAKAESEANKQRYRVKEELWPQARAFARAKLVASNEKVTEGKVEEQATSDEDYQIGQSRLLDLEAVASTLRAAEKAMAQRLEMLRSLNSRQRVELGGLPTSDSVDEAREAYRERRRQLQVQAAAEQTGENG